MITQGFLLEFEVSLLKAYNQAAKKGLPTCAMNTNFLAAATSRDSFTRTFLDAFKEREEVLEREIGRGGHHDPKGLLSNISRMIENKLTTAVFHKNNQLKPEEFQQLVRELKRDVRNIFYEKYLSR